MIYRIHIKFTTNFLGGGPRDKRSAVRHLKKTSEGAVEIHSQQFMEKLKLANEQLDGNLDTTKFKIPDGFHAMGLITTCRRVYNKVNVDLFEGITKGKKVKLEIMYDDKVENSPDVDIVGKLFDVIGRFHGISQWGSKFHCGRFTVLKTEKITIDNYDN